MRPNLAIATNAPARQLLNEREAFNRQIKKTVLIADDDWSERNLLETILKAEGYRVLATDSADAAMTALKASYSYISLVILNLHMNGQSSLDAVQEMRENPEFSFIPVIVQTPPNDAKAIRDSIRAGVYYCLGKPCNRELLVATTEAAIEEFSAAQQRNQALISQREGMALVETARFTCRTLKEVNMLAHVISSSFPDPQRAIIGVTELLINAVEHGNLGITYMEKTQLLTSGRWRETVDARQAHPDYVSKTVDIVLQRKDDGVYLQITDEGPGFEWWRYLEIDPARAGHPNGRGVALANKISFDRLQFTRGGSRVLAMVQHQAPGIGLKW